MDFLGLRTLTVIAKALARDRGEPRRRRSTSTPSRWTTRRRSRCCSAADVDGVFQVESRRHEARAPEGPQADRVRRHRRRRGAVPPGPDGLDPGLRRAQARPHAGHLLRRPPQADPRGDLRHDGLPGAGHAHLDGDGGLHGGQGGQAAQGHGQEEPRDHRRAASRSSSRAPVERGYDKRAGRAASGRDIEKFAEYAFNKSHAAAYGAHHATRPRTSRRTTRTSSWPPCSPATRARPRAS